MDDSYIRPPIIAVEPASQRVAVWRFRVVLLVLFAALAIGIFFLFRAIVNPVQGNAQGLAQGLSQWHAHSSPHALATRSVAS